MPRLLVVHHTTSPALQAMLEAAVAGARDPELEGIEVAVVPALAATVTDVLAADGFLLGTPANIGYMSGALKHFFDQIYYPCLLAKTGRALRPLRARRERHHRRGPGGDGHRDGPGLGAGLQAGGNDRPGRQGR